VAALGGPMSQLASFGAILQRPLALILVALVALFAWGGVTFLAVRLAIISAARATGRA